MRSTSFMPGKVNKPGDAVWSDKTASITTELPPMVRLFPAAKFIVMARDVFNTAYSCGAMPGRDGALLDDKGQDGIGGWRGLVLEQPGEDRRDVKAAAAMWSPTALADQGNGIKDAERLAHAESP